MMMRKGRANGANEVIAMNAKLILIVLAGMVALALPHSASGQDQPYFGGYGCWSGYGYPQTYYGGQIPYFALYPPVYYSHRVARTYGYGPFAYPAGVLTPGSQRPGRPWCRTFTSRPAAKPRSRSRAHNR